MFTLKVYLKHVRKTFAFEFDKESQIEEIITQLKTRDIIVIGPLIFNRDELSYMFWE